MRVVRAVGVALVVGVWGILGASCLEQQDEHPGEATEAYITPSTPTNACEDACWQVYLSDCQRCKVLGLGRWCYARAMADFATCLRDCR